MWNGATRGFPKNNTLISGYDKMTDTTIPRIFVKPDDTATIVCPHCQLSRTVAVGKFRSSQHVIKARCTCGHGFAVHLDFRKHYRKKTSLRGTYTTQTAKIDEKHWKSTKLYGVYTMQAPAAGMGHMQVTNISAGGLQFTTPGDHAIEIGQQAYISFTLDDRRLTQISKRVTIQSVTKRTIGCQFDSNEPLEQGLRFYLFP